MRGEVFLFSSFLSLFLQFTIYNFLIRLDLDLDFRRSNPTMVDGRGFAAVGPCLFLLVEVGPSLSFCLFVFKLGLLGRTLSFCLF